MNDAKFPAAPKPGTKIKIRLAGGEWTVIFRNNLLRNSYGNCLFKEHEIHVTTNKAWKNYWWVALVHEITEGVWTEMRLRYEAPGNREFLFIGDHAQFSNIMEEVAGAIQQVLEVLK